LVHELKLNSLRSRLSPSFGLNRKYLVFLSDDVGKSLFENLYPFTRKKRVGTAQSVKWQDYRLNDGEKRLGTRQMQETFLFSKNFRPALVPKHPPWQWMSAVLSPGEIFWRVKPTTFDEFKNEWNINLHLPHVFMTSTRKSYLILPLTKRIWWKISLLILTERIISEFYYFYKVFINFLRLHSSY
jgi:hypothetical protein